MLDSEQMKQFSQDWIEAWNAHDLERILSHYDEAIEFSSPYVVKVLGLPQGTIRGKDSLRRYFAKALQAYPTLRFESPRLFVGVDTVVLHYQSVNGQWAAEVMRLDADGKVLQVWAHYAV